MAVKDRGFGSMDPEKQRLIAGMGGKKAHAMGKGHRWTTAEARKAEQKGQKIRWSKYK